VFWFFFRKKDGGKPNRFGPSIPPLPSDSKAPPPPPPPPYIQNSLLEGSSDAASSLQNSYASKKTGEKQKKHQKNFAKGSFC